MRVPTPTRSKASPDARGGVPHDGVAPCPGGGVSATVITMHDSSCREPPLPATPLPLSPRVVRDCSRDRRPAGRLPLAAKHMIGAARRCVHAPETCRRRPALASLAGAVLAYAAATTPTLPTGSRDRRPRPTPGCLRRLLAQTPFPHDSPLPARLRVKTAAPAQPRTGFGGQRRPAGVPLEPTPLADAA